MCGTDNVIKNIEGGSPASHTRIAVGDLLLEVNGHKIKDVLDIILCLDKLLLFNGGDADGILKRSGSAKGRGGSRDFL